MRRAANRLILLSVVLVVGLCALGLWVTESSGGPETRAGSFYLAAAGIGVLAFVVAGVLLTLARRRRP
jgi:hypothetical protein